MTRLHYPLPEIPGCRVVHMHDEGESCQARSAVRRGCFYTPTALTRLRRRALRLFRPAA